MRDPRFRPWLVTAALLLVLIGGAVALKMAISEDNLSAARTAALIGPERQLTARGAWVCTSWGGDGAEGLHDIDYLSQIPGQPSTRTAVATDAKRITGYEPLGM